MHLLCEIHYKILNIVQFYKNKNKLQSQLSFQVTSLATEKVAKRDIIKNGNVLSGLHIFIQFCSTQ